MDVVIRTERGDILRGVMVDFNHSSLLNVTEDEVADVFVVLDETLEYLYSESFEVVDVRGVADETYTIHYPRYRGDDIMKPFREVQENVDHKTIIKGRF